MVLWCVDGGAEAVSDEVGRNRTCCKFTALGLASAGTSDR